jgi:hypothetical protein
MRMNPDDWDSLSRERQDHQLDRKRASEAAIGERVGWEPDWKLKLVMLRERRQQEEYDRRSAALSTPENRAKRSAVTKRNWEQGKYAQRQQWCRHRSPEKVQRAKRLKSEGWTIAEIAHQLGCSAYAIAQWLGWKRGASRVRAPQPVVFQGVHYRSLAEAERDTGVARRTIKKRTAAG